MIVYDLKCRHGHVFEAWFGSASDFETQQQRGLVACPLCNTGEVERLPSLMAIGGKAGLKAEAEAEAAEARAQADTAKAPAAAGASGAPARGEADAGSRAGAAGSAPPPAPPMPAVDVRKAKAMLEAMAKAQAEAVAKSDYVGPRFAEEARAMHYGEQDARPIYGETRPEDARALREEGIPAMPLLFPVKQQSDA